MVVCRFRDAGELHPSTRQGVGQPPLSLSSHIATLLSFSASKRQFCPKFSSNQIRAIKCATFGPIQPTLRLSPHPASLEMEMLISEQHVRIIPVPTSLINSIGEQSIGMDFPFPIVDCSIVRSWRVMAWISEMKQSRAKTRTCDWNCCPDTGLTG